LNPKELSVLISNFNRLVTSHRTVGSVDHVTPGSCVRWSRYGLRPCPLVTSRRMAGSIGHVTQYGRVRWLVTSPSTIVSVGDVRVMPIRRYVYASRLHHRTVLQRFRLTI